MLLIVIAVVAQAAIEEEANERADMTRRHGTAMTIEIVATTGLAPTVAVQRKEATVAEVMAKSGRGAADAAEKMATALVVLPTIIVALVETMKDMMTAHPKIKRFATRHIGVSRKILLATSLLQAVTPAMAQVVAPSTAQVADIDPVNMALRSHIMNVLPMTAQMPAAGVTTAGVEPMTISASSVAQNEGGAGATLTLARLARVPPFHSIAVMPDWTRRQKRTEEGIDTGVIMI